MFYTHVHRMCVLLLVSASASALAADSETSGFYRIGSVPGVKIVPFSEDGLPISSVRQSIGGVEEDFYPGSVCLAVELSETVQGRQYLLRLVRKNDGSILFVDQSEGGGKLTFYVRPPIPDDTTEYELVISSDAEGFSALFVPVSYAAKTDPAPQPANTVCPRDSSCPMSAFSDLDVGAWYHDGVHWALENEIMNGYPGGLFGPDKPTSRAMIVTMLYRFEGEPLVSYDMEFTDVKDGMWYTEAIRWAAANGIVEGYGGGRFGPDDPLKREQLAAILCRYAKFEGADTSAGELVPLNRFTDAADVSEWAVRSMRWAVDAGIINGISDDLIGPGRQASRAQVATMLMRYAALGQ